MAEQIVHPLQPIYDEHSRVLILGTMPSPASRAAAFYYAHPQNRFWRTLCAVLGEEIPATNAEKASLARKHKIALWDTLASCDILGAADSSIKNPIANDFAPIFAVAQIQAIFTTGQKATQLYNRYCIQQCRLPAQMLPSPSPANCAVKPEAL
ncbi:MAG: DNA-deoxyinosine glycosylase, partial [Pygmaiobacter sp.]